MDTIDTATEGRWNKKGRGSNLGAAPCERRRAGFTMIELLVAIMVLLIATAAAFGSQIASFGVIDSSRDASVVMMDLEACMEQVLVQSADNVPVVFPAGQRITDFDEAHVRGEAIVPSYPGYAGGAVPDPLNVVLTATWLDSRGRPQRLSLGTLVTR